MTRLTEPPSLSSKQASKLCALNKSFLNAISEAISRDKAIDLCQAVFPQYRNHLRTIFPESSEAASSQKSPLKLDAVPKPAVNLSSFSFGSSAFAAQTSASINDFFNPPTIAASRDHNSASLFESKVETLSADAVMRPSAPSDSFKKSSSSGFSLTSLNFPSATSDLSGRSLTAIAPSIGAHSSAPPLVSKSPFSFAPPAETKAESLRQDVHMESPPKSSLPFTFGGQLGNLANAPTEESIGLGVQKPPALSLNDEPSTAIVPSSPAQMVNVFKADPPVAVNPSNDDIQQDNPSDAKPAFLIHPPQATPTFSFGVSPPTNPKAPFSFGFGAFGVHTGTLETKIGETNEANKDCTEKSSIEEPINETAAPTTASAAPPTSAAFTATPFSFAIPGGFSFAFPAAKSAAEDGPKTEEEDSSIPEGEEESFGTGKRADSELLKRGAGEEEEQTLVEERIKLFILEKERGWVDLGLGWLKINEQQRPSAQPEGPEAGDQRGGRRRRLIFRLEGSGKILLNTWLNSVSTSVAPLADASKAIMMTCVNCDGRIGKYLVRCKTVDVAANIHRNLQESLG